MNGRIKAGVSCGSLQRRDELLRRVQVYRLQQPRFDAQRRRYVKE